MTYTQFLAVFLVPPILALAVLGSVPRRVLVALPVLAGVAVLYTAPWDNLIILNGVWSYGRHQVTGILIGHVPLEEYAFYVLQVALAGLLTARLLRRRA